jgi:hypothetical protein
MSKREPNIHTQKTDIRLARKSYNYYIMHGYIPRVVILLEKGELKDSSLVEHFYILKREHPYSKIRIVKDDKKLLKKWCTVWIMFKIDKGRV